MCPDSRTAMASSSSSGMGRARLAEASAIFAGSAARADPRSFDSDSNPCRTGFDASREVSDKLDNSCPRADMATTTCSAPCALPCAATSFARRRDDFRQPGRQPRGRRFQTGELGLQAIGKGVDPARQAAQRIDHGQKREFDLPQSGLERFSTRLGVFVHRLQDLAQHGFQRLETAGGIHRCQRLGSRLAGGAHSLQALGEPLESAIQRRFHGLRAGRESLSDPARRVLRGSVRLARCSRGRLRRPRAAEKRRFRRRCVPARLR